MDDGAVVQYGIRLNYVRYLLAPEELWARSYAQYVAMKSGSQPMQDHLDRIRERPEHGFYYCEQWDDDEFLPIMAEIDKTFRLLDWVK